MIHLLDPAIVEAFIARWTPEPAKPAAVRDRTRGQRATASDFDPVRFVTDAGFSIGPARTLDAGGTLYELDTCPCGRGEKGCALTVATSGAVGLGCKHDTCEHSEGHRKPGDSWKAFRAQLDAAYRDRTAYPSQSPDRPDGRRQDDGSTAGRFDDTDSGAEPIVHPSKATTPPTPRLTFEPFMLPSGKIAINTGDGWAEYSREAAPNAFNDRGVSPHEFDIMRKTIRTAAGYAFDPRTTSVVTVTDGGQVALNTYRGLPLTPRQGDWTPIRRLLAHLTADEPGGLEYALDWHAAPLQSLYSGRGAYRCRGALLFHGTNGIGKGFWLALLRRIYGASILGLSQHQLDDAFSPRRMGQSLMIVGDEITCAGAKGERAFQQLKLWIADEMAPIRAMHTQSDECRIFCNLMFFSNKRLPFTLDGPGDRRFSVWWQGSPLDPALVDELDALNSDRWTGVAEAFLWHLVHERVVTRKLREPFDNAARCALVAGSAAAVRAFADAIAEDGWIDLSRAWRLEEAARLTRAGVKAPDVRVHRDGLVLNSMLYEAFALWRARHGYDPRDQVSEAELIRTIRARMPDLEPDLTRARVGDRRGRGLRGFKIAEEDDDCEDRPAKGMHLVPPIPPAEPPNDDQGEMF